MFTIPQLTSDILAINLDAPGSPEIDVDLLNMFGTSHSFGWGFGWYPAKQYSALVVKDPTTHGTRISANEIADWSNFRSSIFFCKVRGAESTYHHTETQPFSRSFAGRDWLFLHNGDLDKVELDRLHGRQKRLLEPLGRTDSELAFCHILAQMQEGHARQLSEVEPQQLHAWFQSFDAIGSADMFIADGRTLACFQGTQSPKQLYFGRMQPPNNTGNFQAEAIHLQLSDPRDSYRTMLIVTSTPFSGGEWTLMQPGQLILASRGAIVWDSHAGQVQTVAMPLQQQPAAIETTDNHLTQMQSSQAQAQSSQAQGAPHVTVTNVRSITRTVTGKELAFRQFEITHTTNYQYTIPVEHSTHVFRLQPVIDEIQDVSHSKLAVSSWGEEILYEDVFGNHCIHCTIDQPYSYLSVAATSVIKIFELPPDDHSLSRRQSSIPLVWMPWQRQMMMPYLLPPELPEPQLLELTDYAMGFAERNDYHLLKILQDINLSIYRDYKYVPGSTSLNTTPFEVYATRQGVCQDFANLFICLAQLLGVPARYRMGYIYTGANYENKIQSDASHAWAEAYLPYVGWRGFDPTNGCLVGQDHIRVACGRNYIDATPTSGTIYKGGGDETLTVDVKVREIIK